MLNGSSEMKRINYFDSLNAKENLESGGLSNETATAIAKEMRYQNEILMQSINENSDELKTFVDRTVNDAMDRLASRFWKMLIAGVTVMSTVIGTLHLIK